MEDAKEKQGITIRQSLKPEEVVEPFVSTFQVQNFTAKYVNRIRTMKMDSHGQEPSHIKIQNSLQSKVDKLAKTTKLQVGDQVIYIKDVFEYDGHKNCRSILIKQDLQITSEGEQVDAKKSIGRRNTNIINRRVAQLFRAWLSRKPKSTLQAELKTSRKTLNRLLCSDNLSVDTMFSNFGSCQLQRMLVEFLKDQEWDALGQMSVTICRAQVQQIVKDLISRCEQKQHQNN